MILRYEVSYRKPKTPDQPGPFFLFRIIESENWRGWSSLLVGEGHAFKVLERARRVHKPVTVTPEALKACPRFASLVR